MHQVEGDVLSDPDSVMLAIGNPKHSYGDPEVRSLVHDERWPVLCKLVTRPWFTRVWIIQELLSSQGATMLSGYFEMSPYVVLNAAKLLILDPMLNTRLVQSPGAIANYHQHRTAAKLADLVMIRNSNGEVPLLYALSATQYSRCTDSRDRIFAVLLLSPRSPQGFIDYSKDRTTISLNLAEWLLGEADHPAEVLWDAQKMDHLAGTPSWAPDYSSLAKPNPFSAVGQIFQTDESLDYGAASWRVEPGGVRIQP
jgi:hypothetical protein